MADYRKLRLGPWPLGIDNVHQPSHAVFQLGDEQSPPRLQAATDVILSDVGWPSCRPQVAEVSPVTTGQGMTQLGERLFYQVNGALYEMGNATALVTELSRKALLGEFGGRIFGTDDLTFFEIADSSVLGWGLPVPSVSLAAATGTTFDAGTYQIECTFVDTRNEGGASTVETITLAAASDINVTVSGIDSRVAGINQYISKVNQPTTSFAKLVASAGSPSQAFTAAAATTVNSPPTTRRMQGPPSGLDGLFAFRAFLMGWRGNAVFRSQAQEPHLFLPKEWVYQTPGSIRAGAGLPNGFALGTDAGIWWMTGDEPPYIGVQKTYRPVLKGAFTIEGWKLPFLQTQEPVILMIDKTGLVVVTASGEIVSVTQNRYHVDMDTYTEAQFAFVDQHLLVELR